MSGHFLIHLYIIIGFYMAGQVHDDHEGWRWWLCAFLYVLIGPVLLLIAGARDAWQWTNSVFQVNAVFKFYFLRGFRNEPEGWLENANTIAHMHTGVRGFMWRWLVERINRANGYTPSVRDRSGTPEPVSGEEYSGEPDGQRPERPTTEP